MLAIFSAINPSSYVVPLASTYGTFTETPGTVENIHSALTPFHKDRFGNFHTPTTARDTNSFGYTYPEVVDWNVTPQQLASSVRAAVNALYGPQGTLSKKRSVRFSSRIMPRQSLSISSKNSTGGTIRDWLINMSVERDQTKPFYIHFFLGAPPTDVTQWKLAGNLIVSQAVISDVMSGEADRTVPAIASIPLMRTLAKVNRDSSNVNGTVAFLRVEPAVAD
jgi:tyrosinase